MTQIQKLSANFAFLLLVFLLSSCSKENSEKINTLENEKFEISEIPPEDISEKDEDLLTVDYKIFYDELAPYGEWIEVTGKEIGLDLKRESGSGSINNSDKSIEVSFSELFGIKDAYAAEFEFGSFFVWKPSPNLAVSTSAGESPAFTPYSNGQWIYTSHGWYFKAPTAHEEIIHHYGRWVHSPAMGWIWVPGRVWAPAWVDWREDDDNLAWAPVPPSVYLVAGEVPEIPVYEDNYIIVGKNHFVEPVVYKYIYRDKVLIKNMKRLKGVAVVNNIIVNQGPAVLEIEKVRGSNINVVKVHKVNNIKEIQFTGSDINVFTPMFRKVKPRENITYNHVQPRKYTKYDATSFNNNVGHKSLESASKKINPEKNSTSDDRIDNENDKQNLKDNTGKKVKTKERIEFRKKESNSTNNKRTRDLNNNKLKEKRNNCAVKENRKSRKDNNNKERDRNKKNKNKRSYYDEDNSTYDFKIRHGVT